jgi:hypothetical protein
MLTLTTPAVVFSTISLLLLAYTNRFVAISAVIRGLHSRAKDEGKRTEVVKTQIDNLKKRVNIIKNMQFFAILSLFFCVFSMFLLFFQKDFIGEIVFALALILLMISLALSAWEIKISVEALNTQLSECIGEECYLD